MFNYNKDDRLYMLESENESLLKGNIEIIKQNSELKVEIKNKKFKE